MTFTATDVVKFFFDIVGIFFLIYLIGYSTFLLLSVIVGSSELYRKRRQEKLKNVLLDNYYVPVSIIVPAYNEEVTVVQTVQSLLYLDYKVYEIVVVDDGSKDQTAKKIIDTFNLHPISQPIHRCVKCKYEKFIYKGIIDGIPITLVSKENGGKADSLNMGINVSKYPYFICMDADSILQYDSLTKIVQPVLDDTSVVAVGGAVRPSNDVELERGRVYHYRMPKNILASMQVLEYDRSFLAARILFDKFNGSIIISGAFGLFRKDIVISAGGYDTSTMGEDMELVVKLHVFCRENNVPYKIKYASNAICWSQAPEKLKDLRKQRRRWHIGLFQSMWKYKNIFANPKFGTVSFISYLYFLFYELLSPYIEIFGIITIVLAFFFDLINVPFMILFFLIYCAFGSILSITAFFARIQTIDLKISLKDGFKALLLCGFEVGFLRFVIAFVRGTAFIGYRKKKLHWGKIERKDVNVK